MNQILFHYERIDPATWAYLSSLLMIGLYFMFNRFWSVRNLDLALLILLAPGLLLVYEGRKQKQAIAANPINGVHPASLINGDEPKADSEVDQDFSDPLPDTSSGESVTVAEQPLENTEDDPESARHEPSPASPDTQEPLPESKAQKNARLREYSGFVWLLAVCGLLLIRLLIDPIMVRRPLLEPNLSTGGLIFLGCSLFVFLMANVVTSTSDEQYRSGPQLGPGYPLLNMLPTIPTTPEYDPSGRLVGEELSAPLEYATTARVIAILGHWAVVIGIVAIGYRHFDNVKTGVGTATMYLMLPYTAQMTGHVAHVLPAAFLVWAIVFYRRPLLSGMFLGLAMGTVYYPFFLLPLWISFYWQRGLMRFVAGVATTICLLVLLLFVRSGGEIGGHLQQMFGLWFPVTKGLQGIWGLGWNANYRLPVLASFIALSVSFALWPAQKNLGTLLSCSAAIMVAAQFWHGYGGGLYMAWYLPLLLLTIFRPNLEDRIALSVLGQGWIPRRRLVGSSIDRAA